ncbi:MAG: hypothetical protein J7J78_03440 [Thermoprotei archaeon]|nr:hypothetical protein [Thermoprotei archaeon]
MRNRNETYCLKELVKSGKIRKIIESLASGEKVFLLADVLNEDALGLAFITLAFKKLRAVPILITYPQNASTIVSIFKNLGLKISSTFPGEDICLRIVPLESKKAESEILKIIAKYGIHNTLYLGSKKAEDTFLRMLKTILEKTAKLFSILKSDRCIIKENLIEHPCPDLVSYVIFNSVFKDESHTREVFTREILVYEEKLKEKQLKDFTNLKHLIMNAFK